MKNWNRMQNAAALGAYFIDVRNMHDCYRQFDYMRISLTREKYWYEIRDVLVPILHGVKFTKCEIYGSTRLSYLTMQNRLNKLMIPPRQKAQWENGENRSSCFREESV